MKILIQQSQDKILVYHCAPDTIDSPKAKTLEILEDGQVVRKFRYQKRKIGFVDDKDIDKSEAVLIYEVTGELS